MGKHQIAVDFLKVKTNGQKIVSDSIVSYKTRYELADLADDDHITKYLLSAIIPPPLIGFQEPFGGSITGKVINWQTDIPNGQTQSYANLLGNEFPKPYIFTGSDHSWDKVDFSMNVQTNGDDTQIDTVTLDWTVSTDGYIQW